MIRQIENLECSKEYVIEVLGKEFVIKNRQDIYNALDYRDNLIEKNGIKRYRKLLKKKDKQIK